MKPRWLRRHLSCPDCGYVIEERDWDYYFKEGFDCPRCKVHYAGEDFNQLTMDKYSTKADV